MTPVLVYGAYGHTGRFVVAELHRRGFNPIPSGRDATRLPSGRQATVDNPNSLDRALNGAAAVINCAGPFATTAIPLIEAAARAGIPYVDVAAEIEANVDTFALKVDTTVVPAMAFFGGLADLLATAAMDDWKEADEIHVAYGLTAWNPTPGTLAAGKTSHKRRGAKRIRFTDGHLEHHTDALRTQEWKFPDPLGPQQVLAEFSMADIVTIPSHVKVPKITSYMTTKAAKDLSKAAKRNTPETFMVEVVVQAKDKQRRATARGKDIYAVSAPLAVEAVSRILTGRTKTKGVASAGEIFDAKDFLQALHPHIAVDLT